MRQFLLPQSYHGESRLSLAKRERHYLMDVLRYQVGDSFNGIDQNGVVYDLTLESEDTLLVSKAANGKAKEEGDSLPAWQQKRPKIHLLQCLCKGKKDEQITRMAAEIGASSITFVHSRYCVVDFKGKKDKALQARNERLEAIIREAVQQSGSPTPTRLTPDILDIADVPAFTHGKLAVFFHQARRQDEQADLASLMKAHDPQDDLYLLIGSEGGLSDEECAMLEKGGLKPVLLKTNILRAETAAPYALAVCQYALTERS